MISGLIMFTNQWTDLQSDYLFKVSKNDNVTTFNDVFYGLFIVEGGNVGGPCGFNAVLSNP